MYQFCNSHRTYDTVAKETFLPQDGYKETHLSRSTINKWFSYFRLFCMKAQKKVAKKIGGEGDTDGMSSLSAAEIWPQMGGS